jgi:hypothetical protein
MDAGKFLDVCHKDEIIDMTISTSPCQSLRMLG